MKKLKFCYFTLMVTLLFAALLTGRREFFLLLFMLFFVAVYALALNLWTIFSFTFVQELSSPSGIKGGLVQLKIRIHNDKPFPFTLMRIQVETSVPSEKTALRFNLSPKESISFEVPLSCAYRGEFSVGMTVMDITDIFGLFKIRYNLQALPYYRQRRLKIYPRIISLGFLPAGTRDAKLSGGAAVRSDSGGESLYGIREYREGDSLRHIHWTASARAGKLFSKTYEMPSQSAALIAVDNRSNGLEGEALLQYADLASECACAIAQYCFGKGREVKLIAAGPDKPSLDVRGKSGFSEIYESLTVMPFGVEDGLADKIRAEARKGADLCAIYVLSCRQDAELDELLTESVKMGRDVKYLLLNAGGASERRDPARQSFADCAEISYGDDVAAVLEGLV